MSTTSFPQTIVFVHGSFMNPVSWGGWTTFFRIRGYHCHAPAYPFHDGIPENLRNSPPVGLATLTFRQVVDHMTAFVDGLRENPILIGHSMGGLVVQKVLERGRGVAAVAISSAPPARIISWNPRHLWTKVREATPLSRDTPRQPTASLFYDVFCPPMTFHEAAVEFRKIAVPESRNLLRTSIGKQARIDFKKPHPPLLFVSGENDKIFPASLNQKNFEAYSDPGSTRQIAVFPNRAHYLCNQNGWKEIAHFVAEWLEIQSRKTRIHW